ncbi:hypothetical protein IAQ61_005473 [Plenodomus lingam]|uniref:uncharacterized protein n=1 Tax=Leptosphaeria maculans TaxID=5022 RepID=UPI0033287E22|nr:hypothetical protein IAQ61_005473 [Plenodomus lingam]
MTTTSSAAQDEFNELLRDKHIDNRHPEDRLDDSDLSSPDSPGAAHDYDETVDSDDQVDMPSTMRANYYMPALRSEANTGPKGVIADAQAFEQAKKQARRFTWKAKNSAAAGQNFANLPAGGGWQDEKSSDEDSDEGFMRVWRDQRLRELQSVGERIRSRTNSPSRRIWGSMPEVDPLGYLDAVDKTAPNVVVVVFIRPRLTECPPDALNKEKMAPIYAKANQAEACMYDVAKRNDTVRFVLMYGDDAEQDDDRVLPAILAYKGGDRIATLLPLLEEFQDEDEISAISLETIMRQNRIL